MDAEINKKELDSIIPKIRRALNRTSELTALETWGNLQDFSPQDQGRLAGSWKLQKKGQRQFVVGTSVAYALVQNDGSDPYMIYPRQAQALRFKVDGDIVFAKSVIHPGIQGTHYIEGSIAAAERRIDEFIEIALQEEGL